MEETLQSKQHLTTKVLKIEVNKIIDKNVLVPAIVMVFSFFVMGIVWTIIPDYTTYVGFENKGIFFSVFVISSLMVRVFAGRLSDKHGRGLIAQASVILLCISFLVMAFANTQMALLIGATIFGLGSGMNVPTLYAWAMDLSEASHRGRAMSTMYIALEVGVILGGLCSGWLFNNNPEMFSVVFLLGAASCFSAVVFLLFKAVVGSRKKAMLSISKSA